MAKLFNYNRGTALFVFNVMCNGWCQSLVYRVTMVPIIIAMVMRTFVTAQNCFGGIETFEKVAMTDFDENYSPVGILLQQLDQALTRDCINLCKQQPACLSFGLDYTRFRCAAYSVNSFGRREDLITTNTTNYFEKVCYKGVGRDEYQKVCGVERLWAIERVKGAFLEGFERLQLTNVGSKSECAKSCLMETNFVCRSADYDDVLRICRLSKEDRRTQPQAFRQVTGSSRDYLENQCAAPGPTTCLYDTKRDVGVITMDSLVFAHNPEDCQFKCDKEHTFNCRAFSVIDKRCFLSGDDSVSLTNLALPVKFGSFYGEKKCVTEQCVQGIFTYEKIVGYVIRTAITSPIEMQTTGTLGITMGCKESCDQAHLNCPAFSVNYQNSRCERLDRNSQGRTFDLVRQEGESYFEKICLRVPEIMSMCQDKYWAFERVLGYELSLNLYTKTYNFVQSRRDCEEYCLHEKTFVCRSAYYNDETTDCKLSPEDRRTKPGNYVRNNNPKVNYLENQCIRSHSTCPFEETANAYPTYTDVVEREGITSKESCEHRCNDNTKFLCRSFAYYSSNSQCFLSGDDRASAGNSALQARPGMTFYERKCDKLPSNNATTESEGGTTSSTLPEDNSRDVTRGPGSGGREDDNLNNGGGNGNNNGVRVTSTTSGTSSSSFPSSSSIAGSVGSSTSIGPTTGSGSSPSSSSSTSSTFRPNSDPTTRGSTRPLTESTTRPAPTGVKCESTAKFTFERIPGFEPVGGYLTLLYSDTNNPGIVTDCTHRCDLHPHCRAFVVDYSSRSCHGLFENSSIGRLDLRLSQGKDYFEGFCSPLHLTCDKLWVFDRIVDQASVGVLPKQVVRFMSKKDCRLRCLEEKRFVCSSASYDSSLAECSLYDQDRHSGPLSLLFTKGTDYMENQCSIDEGSCRFLPYERDVTILSVTKSVRGSSTFFCEQECNKEQEFNCRSFTYIDQTTIPGANLCLLSADNRRSSQKGATHFRPRALYGEKDCRGSRKGRVTSSSFPQQPTLSPFFPSSSHSTSPLHSGHSSHTNHLGPNNGWSNNGINGIGTPTTVMGNEVTATCNYNQYTFEKTFGFDIRYARKERSRLPPRLGVAIQCQDECLRRGYRCKAFTIEYGPVQGCFFLDEAVGENRRTLTKLNDVAYFEKICLKERNCGKLWTFERVIGYTLEEAPDKELPNVRLRTTCEDLCLAETTFSCRSAVFEYSNKVCKLFADNRRSRPTSFKPTLEDVDYLENQCVKEPSTCQYRDYTDTFFPYVDRLTHAFSLTDCQRQCDGERLFPCRAVNYETYARDCALVSEDTLSMGSSRNALQQRRHSRYSEKGACEQVTVQCTQQDMILTLNFDSPFTGRVYAKGNPSQCFVVGTGQTHLQFAISLGSKCGTRPEGLKNYANDVVVQNHAVIMTDSDRTIRVLCSFATVDQTVTLTSPNAGKPGIDVTRKHLFSTDRTDSNLLNSRTRLEHPISSVVTNTAPPPSVVMRIIDRSGRDAQVVGLGDELTLRVELKDPSTAFALFARNLYARSSNGESLFLIDNTGCPTDPAIFPALNLDTTDRKSLFATFKAFRFPSTGIVNFEVQVRFCQDKCEPLKCASGFESFGKRRKRAIEGDQIDSNSTLLEPVLEDPAEEEEVEPSLLEPDVDESNSTTNGTLREVPVPTNRSALHAALQPIPPYSASTLPPVLPKPEELYQVASHLQPNDTQERSYTDPNSDHRASSEPMYPKDWTSYGQSSNNYQQPSSSSYPQQPPQTPQSPAYNQYSGYGAGGYSSYQHPNVPSSPYGGTSADSWRRNSYGSGPNGLQGSNYSSSSGYYPQPPPQRPHDYTSMASPFAPPRTAYPGRDGLPTYGSNSRNDFQQNRFGGSPPSSPPMQVFSYGHRPGQDQGQGQRGPPAQGQGQGQGGSASNSGGMGAILANGTPITSSRPLPSKEKGKFRPPRPLPRPKGASPVLRTSNVITAPTERPDQPEIPLSLAIMVGDKDKNVEDKGSAGVNNNDRNTWNIERRPTVTSSSCGTGPAILYTAIVVTLLHCGVMLGGYFYYKRFGYASHSKLLSMPHSVSSENIVTTNISHNPGLAGPQVMPSNANVFYGTPSGQMRVDTREHVNHISVNGQHHGSHSNLIGHNVNHNLNHNNHNMGFRSLYSGVYGSPP